MKPTSETWVQYPLIFQAPISVEMEEYIKRATWEMRRRECRKVSISEYGRTRMLPPGWKNQLEKWRKDQKDFDPTAFAGRKKLEKKNGNKRRAFGIDPALSNGAAQRSSHK